MNDIDKNNIRRLDGGLLLIFRELLIHRRASEAAKSLGLSQSAVSHALKRLRDIIGDPLFIRRSHGLEPTLRALELGPAIDALIEMANGIIAPRDTFDPGTTRRQFKLAVPDFIASILGANLAAGFHREAPYATFVCRSLIVDHALDAVRLGEVDLAIGLFDALPAGLEATQLYEDRYCVVVRKNHPHIQGSISHKAYAETDHVFVGVPEMVASPEKAGIIAQTRAAYGTIPSPDEIATTAYVAQWETALLIASTTDMIAECPRMLAERYVEPLELQLLDPPYDAASRPVLAVKREGANDAGAAWLLGLVRSASK